MRKMKINNNLYIGIVSAGMVVTILLGLLIKLNYAPFGNNTLTWVDATIQYLDFFGYLKDVLKNENNILYSFSKTLGGTNIAIFSYYLSSPLNLFVLFFEKENMHTFFHFLVILKLALATFNFSYFLNKRFASNKKLVVIFLSVGYGLSQYSIAQSCNIMWLDGVYMLPLMMISVHELIYKKTSWKLSVTVGLSILFNWYTGGINCLFIIIWFFFELILKQNTYNNVPLKNKLKECYELLFKYGISMALGVIVSAVLFFPTIGALQSSTRGSLDLSMLFDASFLGDIFSVIQGFTIGEQSQYGKVSLYCGTLAFVGCISCLLSKKIRRQTRIIFGGILVFTTLLFYWKPFFALFSLLKSATSYWYRYSYCGIAVILFISAVYFLTTDFENDLQTLVKSSIACSILLLVLSYINEGNNLERVFYTIIFVLGTTLAIIWMSKSIKSSSKASKNISCLFLILIFSIEILYSTKLQMDSYHSSDVEVYHSYVLANEKQLTALKKYDESSYRISQTSTRNMGNNNLTANYNEALANAYWSISGYTSSPDDIQREFLDRAGYPINGENMCIVNTSILPVDSLLGVKYVLADYKINGLEGISEIGNYNGKQVYKNPYVLPMAITYRENDCNSSYAENPFLYQNKLYSELLGEEIELFVSVNFEIIEKGNTEQHIPQKYLLSIPEGKYAIYGNLPSEYSMNANLDVNGIYQTGYSCWLSPSVFYIPVEEKEPNAIVTIESTTSYSIKAGTEQFYALDLEKFEQIVDALAAREADVIEIENGYAYFEVQSMGKEKLYISIPFDSGWTVKLNGEKIATDLFGECFYSIPLQEGKNIVEMKYEVKFLNVGTVFSVLGLVGIIIVNKKERRKNENIIDCTMF